MLALDGRRRRRRRPGGLRAQGERRRSTPRSRSARPASGASCRSCSARADLARCSTSRQRVLDRDGRPAVPNARSRRHAPRRALVEDARARARLRRADASRRRPDAPSLPDGPLDEHAEQGPARCARCRHARSPRLSRPRRRRTRRSRRSAARSSSRSSTPTVAHKGEIGGVHLGIESAAALDAALDAIDRDQRAVVAWLLGRGARRGRARAARRGSARSGVGTRHRIRPRRTRRRGAPAGDAARAALRSRCRPSSSPRSTRLSTAVAVGAGDPRGRGALLAHPEITEVDVNPVRLTPRGAGRSRRARRVRDRQEA